MTRAESQPMDPRAALDRLTEALEAHFAAVENRRGEADPMVVAAFQGLSDAFETYEEALYSAYDEVTPFLLYDDDEDLEDDDLDDDDLDDEDLDDLDEDDLGPDDFDDGIDFEDD